MLGNKQFELTNHLGNVLATITDHKIPHNNNGTIDYYTADIESCADYYPFGMLMPGRNFNSNSYKFGFNGKLNDNEVYGVTGSFQDYGFRMYDTRICRFISVDPLTKKYPELTPYQFASNSPIMGIDLDGKELFKVTTWSDQYGVVYRTKLEVLNKKKLEVKEGYQVDYVFYSPKNGDPEGASTTDLTQGDYKKDKDLFAKQINSRKEYMKTHNVLDADHAAEITTGQQIYFVATVNYNEDESNVLIDDDMKTQLDKLVDMAGKHADATIYIDSYTNTNGDASHNQELSDDRSTAAEKYLQDKGVTNKIIAKGHGATNTIKDSKGGEDKVKSRRTDIKLAPADATK